MVLSSESVRFTTLRWSSFIFYIPKASSSSSSSSSRILCEEEEFFIMFPKEEEEEEEDKRRVRPRSLTITLALVGGAMLMLFYDGFGGLR